MKLIIAPAGSGKTHFCKRHVWLVDLDQTRPFQDLYKEMRDRYGALWAATPKAIDVYRKKRMRLRAYVSRAPGWGAVADCSFATVTSVFVIPKPSILKARLSAGRPDHHPESDARRVKHVDVDVRQCRDVAKGLGCLILPSFDALEGVIP